MSSESEQKIIESLYNVTIDPAGYDELIHQWQENFDIPDDLNIEDYQNVDYKPDNLSQNVENHFYRALAILDLIGNQADRKATIQEIVEADPLPAFIIDKIGQIILSNAASNLIFGKSEKQNVKNIGLCADSLAQLSLIFKQLDLAPENTALGKLQFEPIKNQKLPDFALTKIYDKNTEISYIYVSALQIAWNEQKANAIQQLYQLTLSELDIAKRLFLGDKISEMADEKQRSIYTIRTQVRAIFKKTGLKTQSELIRLFATLQNTAYQEKDYVLEQVNRPNLPNILVKQDHYIIRPTSRKLYYEIYGKPDGKPVLFLHGMISGTKMPHHVISHLRQQNIKLICPHRAGFGYSDVNRKKPNLVHFVNDIEALLDEEKIKSCPIIGHLDGGYYAYLLGSKIPQRVDEIRNVNACVPIITAKQLNDASPRQRITAYTALYTPKLLPFILRAGIAQVRKVGVANMMTALFEKSAADMRMLADVEIGEIMINGFESCIANGIDSFVNDMTNVISGNWSDLIANCDMPIELFHATDEHVVPIGQVHDLVKRLPQLKLTELAGGQIIFYKYPEIFFKDL